MIPYLGIVHRAEVWTCKLHDGVKAQEPHHNDAFGQFGVTILGVIRKL